MPWSLINLEEQECLVSRPLLPASLFLKPDSVVFGFAGCVLALVGECITVSIFQNTGNTGMAGAAVFFLFLHIVFFSSSIDATSYIYASEIFPTPVRAKGLSVSISGLFMSTIIFLQCAPAAFDEIGWKYYLVFIIITTILFFVVWFYFPEVSRTPGWFSQLILIFLDFKDAPGRHW